MNDATLLSALFTSGIIYLIGVGILRAVSVIIVDQRKLSDMIRNHHMPSEKHRLSSVSGRHNDEYYGKLQIFSGFT